MKAWEETWEAQRYVVEMAGDAGRQLGQFVDDEDDPNNPSCDRDRARLAAAAPEMARLLLEMRRERVSDTTPGGTIWDVLVKAGVLGS